MAVDTLDVMENRPSEGRFSAWAETLGAPIRLARFDCCGQYVCRCRQAEEGDEVTR